MFGLFKKRDAAAAEMAKLVVLTNAAKILGEQLTVCDLTQSELESDGVRGYVWGWFDAALLIAGVSGQGVQFADSMETAFGMVEQIPNGGSYFVSSLSRQGQSTFNQGSKLGQDDLKALASDNKPPDTLVRMVKQFRSNILK